MAYWKQYRLGEILAEKGYIRGPFGSALKRGEMQKTGIPVYEQEHAIYNTRSFRYFIDENKFIELKRFRTKKDDLIISCSGTVGEISIVKEGDPEGIISQALLALRPNTEIISPIFLYYFFKTRNGRNQLLSVSHGSVQANIAKREIVEGIPINVPDTKTQNKITEIISSLDEKIELNYQINQNLDALAQALFKQWFIDFEFPNEKGQPYKSSGGEMVESELGAIPKGWTISKLSTLIQITGGGTPKRANDEYWNGVIPWFSIQDIPNESQVVVIDTLEKITELGLENSSTKILPKGTTIITARGTVGKLALVVTPMAMNQSCYGISGKDGIGPYFNYYNLKHAVKSLQQNTHGAVFDTITTSTFNTVSIAFGPLSLTLHFDESVKSSFEQIEANVRENDNLIKLREALLPKLINGELELSK